MLINTNQINDTTKRFPRTINEAFGPHSSGHIWVEVGEIHKHDKIVIAASIAAAVALLAIIFVWG